MAKDEENKMYSHLSDEQKEYFKQREKDWAAIDARNQAARNSPDREEDITKPAILYNELVNKKINSQNNDKNNNDKAVEENEVQENPTDVKKLEDKKTNKKHVYYIIAWIIGIIILLFLPLGFGISNQIKQLSNTERTHDTFADDVIKHEAKRVAQKEAPAAIKSQIIQIVNTMPLSDLQQAANNQKLFNQIANENDIPQSYINAADKSWFNNQQTIQARQAIQKGQLLQFIKNLEQLNFSNSSQNNKPNVNASAANSN